MMGIFFAFLTALFFAISNILIRKGMERSPEDNGVFMTLTVNILMLGVAALGYRLLIESVPFSLTGFGWFILAGIFTTFLGRTTLFKSIRLIGPTRGTAIKNSAPLFTILFAVTFFNERMEGMALWGALLVLIGLFIQGYFMVRTEGEQSQAAVKKDERVGYMIALLAALTFGLGQVFRKPGVDAFPDPFFGAFVSAVVAFVALTTLQSFKTNVKAQFIYQIKNRNLYYAGAGVATGAAMISFFTGITYIEVSYVSVIAALEPLLTIILATLFLKGKERIYKYTLWSAAIVFAGVILIVLYT
ncbi:DMT family transporter [Salsuginibacillus kocurii]|uniref:DMT family transporter n=1 Tax=Salsuginibacillus kocurii TaxID=427078 RepID=UPI0003A3E9BC|nr:DMT family transporter [Salsuginibacillus kocurii]